MSEKYLDDKFLFDFFLKKIDTKKLFKQNSGEIKKKIKVLLENEIKIVMMIIFFIALNFFYAVLVVPWIF